MCLGFWSWIFDMYMWSVLICIIMSIDRAERTKTPFLSYFISPLTALFLQIFVQVYFLIRPALLSLWRTSICIRCKFLTMKLKSRSILNALVPLPNTLGQLWITLHQPFIKVRNPRVFLPFFSCYIIAICNWNL